MPELPEVETVRAGLERALIGATFGTPEVRHARATNPKSPHPIAAIANTKITGVFRRGKFLWIQSDQSLSLVAHLGMSGQFRIQPVGTPDEKHLRARFPLFGKLGNGLGELRFIDQRTFGWVAVATSEELPPAMVTHIALDPFDRDFNQGEVISKIRAKRSEIKRVILDQKVVSGIGNIYADESLWRSKIHPRIPANELSKAKVRSLLDAAVVVMSEALAKGGTSFDALYVNVDGDSGYFENALEVYGQEGRPCSRCHNLIVRIHFANRSSHLCPSCQKITYALA